MFFSLLVFINSVLLSYSPNVFSVVAFNPLEYRTSAVTCPAFDRVLRERVNITIEYVDINPLAETTILMVHGWPSLWSSWGRQIQHLKDEYHLIAIDVRGFGGSSHPLDVQSSGTMADVTGDLTCVLEHTGVASAICMGHDWGSVACYEAARRRPDVFSAVIGVTVPYRPSAVQFRSTESISELIPTLSYQVYFARNTSEAIIELNKDVGRTLRGTLRSVASPPPKAFLRSRESFMGAWDGIEISPIPFLSREEEGYFIERFSGRGFDHTLFFYTTGNEYGSWESTRDQGNFTIPQPVLSVLPLEDPVADWVMVAENAKATEYLPQLTTKTMRGAHWPHMEFPDAFNMIVDEWLVGAGLTEKTSEQIQPVGKDVGRHSMDDEL